MKTFFLVILGFSTIVSAHFVLFFDFNNAPFEIAVVARGRPTTVLPSFESINAKSRAQIEAITRKSERLFKLSQDCFNNDLSLPCQTLKVEFNVHSKDDVWDLTGQFGKEKEKILPSYGHNELEQDLLKTFQQPYDTIIVSGHHANGYIAGELFSAFEFNILADLARRHPQIFAKAKYLAIFGCESGHPDIIKRWSEVFPSVKLVIASAGVAPLKTNPNNIQFISRLMNQIDLIEQNGGLSEKFSLPQFFNNIRSIGWKPGVLYKKSPSETLYLN